MTELDQRKNNIKKEDKRTRAKRRELRTVQRSRLKIRMKNQKNHATNKM